jgi:DNA-directed RNA polymerase subunit RPC12/RpoP
MEADNNTEKRFCRYCGSRLMVDVKALSGKMTLAVKCTKCKRQNIIEEESE